jgi:hypothetical protein
MRKWEKLFSVPMKSLAHHFASLEMECLFNGDANKREIPHSEDSVRNDGYSEGCKRKTNNTVRVKKRPGMNPWPLILR